MRRRLNTYFIPGLFLSCVAVWGCEARNDSVGNGSLYHLTSENEEAILNLVYSSQIDTFFHFNSRGGKTSTSLNISRLISDRNLSIIVDDICNSNCAEIILPSAKAVYFLDEPIIGFHGNILSYRYYIESQTGLEKKFCRWDYAEEMEKLYKTKELKINFWEDQMFRLKPNISFEKRPGKCPIRYYNFENDIWLPTSEQLQQLWGLNFVGEVCADDIKTCKSKIDFYFSKGKRIIVGDDLYVSKGEN